MNLKLENQMAKKKYKYMLITRTLSDGGAERFVATFSDYLAQRGEKVYVVCWNRSENEYSVGEKAKLMYLPEHKDNVLRKAHRIIDVRTIIKQVNPDFVIPFMEGVIFCAMLSLVGKNGKLIYTQRNSPWYTKNMSLYAQLLRYIVVRKADAIMTQTKDQAIYFDKQKKKVWIVPNPVNAAFFEVKKEKYSNRIEKLIMVGRLSEEKNYELALRCYKRLHVLYPKLELEIYGEGPEKGRLLKLIEELQVTKTCRLMGRSNNVERKMINADLYLLTSSTEGMPNALMEAMALGIPSISSDCKTGPSDLIVPEITGMLFKNEDMESLFEKIEFMIRNPDKARDMGINGRNFMMENYTLDNTYKCFIRMCDGIN